MPFRVPEGGECATSDCSEYTFTFDTDTQGFNGIYAEYPSRGYVIDFDANREDNEIKVKKLKENKWIDQSTRAV